MPLIRIERDGWLVIGVLSHSLDAVFCEKHVSR